MPEDDPLDGVHAQVGAGVVVGVVEVRLGGKVLSELSQTKPLHYLRAYEFVLKCP